MVFILITTKGHISEKKDGVMVLLVCTSSADT